MHPSTQCQTIHQSHKQHKWRRVGTKGHKRHISIAVCYGTHQSGRCSRRRREEEEEDRMFRGVHWQVRDTDEKTTLEWILQHLGTLDIKQKICWFFSPPSLPLVQQHLLSTQRDVCAPPFTSPVSSIITNLLSSSQWTNYPSTEVLEINATVCIFQPGWHHLGICDHHPDHRLEVWLHRDLITGIKRGRLDGGHVKSH